MDNKNIHKTEEDIIREVAEEEGMTYEEVKEIWDAFKEIKNKGLMAKTSKKSKKSKKLWKKRNKNKTSKESRKNNR